MSGSLRRGKGLKGQGPHMLSAKAMAGSGGPQQWQRLVKWVVGMRIRVGRAVSSRTTEVPPKTSAYGRRPCPLWQ